MEVSGMKPDTRGVSRLQTAPHISGHTLHFDKMWNTINIHYIGDLLRDNGNWNRIEQISTERCTQPTIRRLTTNLHTAKTYFRHHYTNLRHPTTKQQPGSAPHTQTDSVQNFP
jgi:hypothetical protein